MVNRGLPMVYLHPGRAVWGREKVVVSTVLGSCISLTMYCPVCGLWVMTHSQMPGPGPLEIARRPRGDDPQWHFTDSSVRSAVALCKANHLDQMVIKVFGGAQLIAGAAGSNIRGARVGMGLQNAQMALATLQGLGLTPQVSDLGGTVGRKLLFLPHSGEVFLKRLGDSNETSRRARS